MELSGFWSKSRDGVLLRPPLKLLRGEALLTSVLRGDWWQINRWQTDLHLKEVRFLPCHFWMILLFTVLRPFLSLGCKILCFVFVVHHHIFKNYLNYFLNWCLSTFSEKGVFHYEFLNSLSYFEICWFLCLHFEIWLLWRKVAIAVYFFRCVFS